MGKILRPIPFWCWGGKIPTEIDYVEGSNSQHIFRLLSEGFLGSVNYRHI
jgi:hypothetical protein